MDTIKKEAAPEAQVQERRKADKVEQEQKIRQHQLILNKYPHPPYTQRNND
jgi:hypothetical protein